MSPAELKAARKALGLSADKLAKALGLSSGRTIRKWEAGESRVNGKIVRDPNKPIPGPAAKAVGMMVERAGA